jgi:hypothetical protein
LGVLVVLLAGCASDTSDSAAERGGAGADKGAVDELDPSYLPAQETIVLERYGLPDPHLAARSRSKSFQAAVAAFSEEDGVRRAKVEGLPGAVGFRVDHKQAERHLTRWNERYRERGAFVLRYDDTFGYGGRDAILLLPTRDDLEAVDAAGTDGVNWDISHERVVAWLRDLMRTHPFVVTGAGIDFVAGSFVKPPKDALALAKKMYRFCPDIVDQGTETVPALAKELERGTLYLWWD